MNFKKLYISICTWFSNLNKPTIHSIKTTHNGVQSLVVSGANSVSIKNGKIYIDGVLQKEYDKQQINIFIHGDCGEINSTESLTIETETLNGNVSCNNLVCENIRGNSIIVKGNLTCDDIDGNVNVTGNSISGKISGNVSAGGNVIC